MSHIENKGKTNYSVDVWIYLEIASLCVSSRCSGHSPTNPLPKHFERHPKPNQRLNLGFCKSNLGTYTMGSFSSFKCFWGYRFVSHHENESFPITLHITSIKLFEWMCVFLSYALVGIWFSKCWIALAEFCAPVWVNSKGVRTKWVDRLKSAGALYPFWSKIAPPQVY